MKQFKEDKRDLEMKIAEMIKEFCDKYDVSIEDIELTSLGTFVDINKYLVKINVDL